MDPSDILEVLFTLFGFPGLVLIGLLLLALRRRRRRPPADPAEAEAEDRRTPAGAGLLIGVLAAGFVQLDSAAATRWPAARGWLVAAYTALTVAALVVASSWPRRDEFLLSRRVRRGDVAGAIAILEAKVARDPGSGPAPPAATDDNPWAAPASGSRSPAAGPTLAHRLNLLGLLESRREDWARALHWYERAERAGGGGIRDLASSKGLALARLGRVAEGLALVRAAFDALPPAGPRAVRAKITLQLAGALIAAGQLDEARARIDEAEAEVARFSPILARVRPTYRAAARTLRDRLAAAEAGAVPADPVTPA